MIVSDSIARDVTCADDDVTCDSDDVTETDGMKRNPSKSGLDELKQDLERCVSGVYENTHWHHLQR